MNYAKNFAVFERIVKSGGDAICRIIAECVRSGEAEIPVAKLNPDFDIWFRHHPDKCAACLNEFLDERYEQRHRARHFEVKKVKGHYMLVVAQPHHRETPREDVLHSVAAL